MHEEYKHDCIIVNKSACLNIYKPAYNLSHMRYGQRLRAARLHAGFTQAELAVEIGGACTQANISGLEKSLTATGSEFTAQFANACKVNALWLATEDGGMIDNQLSEPVLQVIRRMHTLTEREQYRVSRMVEFYAEPAVNENIDNATPIKSQQ